MQDFEKLGVFYLGRLFDPIKKTALDDLLLYDSKDLVTHAVCVGMTGSGKTGLCIDLLEEAALDGIPSIVIDPKGDISNLLLTFPELRPEDFAPWVNPEDAAKKRLSPENYAAEQAETWKKGLASWGEDGSRIKRLRDASNFVIYTPGSSAGFPVSILKSLTTPPKEIISDDELLQERVNTTVTSLLGLIGLDADPIRSRDHILISTILSEAWSKESSLDLGSLIQQIQTPQIQRIGVLDLDSFYPPRERLTLAMQLNNLLAAPGFRLWLEGEPLDVKNFLYGLDGKPKISIFSIAHLSDPERMFFVSLLLNHLVGWMRTQTGTTSLRAILYIDEVFGYLPPIANPPSKLPLLTLMKQARAFGIGTVLVTQNPVDLDYKSISNTGTWFIGRLQTERDKLRILDALEGVALGSGTNFNRSEMDQIIAGLGNRVFLMHDIYDNRPTVFTSRWAMSYLRGPLTRDQIKSLMDPIKSMEKHSRPSEAPAEPPKDQVSMAVVSQGYRKPILPPEIPQYYLTAAQQKTPLVYSPMVLGVSQLRFTDTKKNVDETKNLFHLATITRDPVPLDWEKARQVNMSVTDLADKPVDQAQYSDLPRAASFPKNYSKWQKDLKSWLVRSQKIELMYSPSLRQYSKPSEKEDDFRIRMRMAAREISDQNAEKIRQKYLAKYASLDEKIRKARMALEKEWDQEAQQKYKSAVSFGSTLLDAFVGRKVKSSASRTARDFGQSQKEKEDVERARQNLDVMLDQRAKLEQEFQKEVKEIDQKTDPLTEKLETFSISPMSSNVAIKLIALVWSPESTTFT